MITKKLNLTQQNNSQSIPTDDYENYFYTHDLGCSGALVSMGFEVISLDKSNPNKVKFVFHVSDKLSEAVHKYWNNNLLVFAQQYFNAIKGLKNQLYSS